MFSLIMVNGSGLSVILFFFLYYIFTNPNIDSNWARIELKHENKYDSNNTMFYTPIMENALTLVIGIGIVVALIFLIVMLIDWITDGVMDIFSMFSEEV